MTEQDYLAIAREVFILGETVEEVYQAVKEDQHA